MVAQTFSKAVTSFLCLLILSSAVNATDHDRWIVRLRAISVSPDDSSGDIAINGTSVPNSGVGVDADIVPELDITYMFTKHIGLELILATSNHNVTARGSRSSLGKVITCSSSDLIVPLPVIDRSLSV